MTMRVVDIFCGCGGLSLGFEKAGFDIVAGIDNWDAAISVYKQNFSHDVYNINLMDIDTAVNTIKPLYVDMIIGGPPCQDFSSAGKRDENNGRGDLTISFAQIVAKTGTEWFVMENVARITKTAKLQEAKKILYDAGYGLTQMTLDASFCGVPQKRKRFVMIGKLHTNDNFMYNELKSKLSDHAMSVAEYFGNTLSISHYYRHPRSYARRGIFSTSEPSPTIRGVNRLMPKGYVLHPNDPVSCLDGIRPLTTEERGMIQTFPKNFVFNGTKTNIEQMIGNAVPVNLGKFIAEAIKRYNDIKHKNISNTKI